MSKKKSDVVIDPAMARENATVFFVKSLAETILYAKKNYYNGYPTFNDEVYDRLEEKLKELCPGHPVLEAVGDASFECLIGVVETRRLVKAALNPVDEDLEDAL